MHTVAQSQSPNCLHPCTQKTPKSRAEIMTCAWFGGVNMCVCVGVGRQTTTNTKMSSTPKPGIQKLWVLDCCGGRCLPQPVWISSAVTTLAAATLISTSGEQSVFLWFLMHESKEFENTRLKHHAFFYSPPQVDRIWLWVYYDDIPIYAPYSIYLRGTVTRAGG